MIFLNFGNVGNLILPERILAISIRDMLPEDADIDPHWNMCEEMVRAIATEILLIKLPP